MIKGKELFFSMFVIVAAMVCVGLCTYHYGMGVEPFYEEQLENMAQVVQDAQWLENGTIVEQIFTNRASYMVGVDLIFINTGEGTEGTLYIQLCSPTGELLAQKRE